MGPEIHFHFGLCHCGQPAGGDSGSLASLFSSSDLCLYGIYVAFLGGLAAHYAHGTRASVISSFTPTDILVFLSHARRIDFFVAGGKK